MSLNTNRRSPHSAMFLALALLLAAGLVAGLAPAVAAAEEGADSAFPVVLSPHDGDQIPRPGEDTSCKESGPCRMIYVKGRLPTSSSGDRPWPFLVVAPLNAAPRIWVQPPITSVRRDGTFEGMVYLGSERAGAGEKFNILVLTHPNKERLHEGDVLMQLPSDCLASDPVTVVRMR